MVKRMVQFFEEPTVVEEIDKAAIARGINRSSYIRQAVRKALREAQKK